MRCATYFRGMVIIAAIGVGITALGILGCSKKIAMVNSQSSKGSNSEYTKYLIDKLGQPERRIVLQAARELMCRLPNPKVGVKLSSKFSAPGCGNKKRLLTAEKAWRPEFAEPVLRHARKILSWRDRKGMEYAAFIIACLGGRDELPIVIEALNYCLGEAEFTPYDVYTALISTVEMLVHQGVDVPASPRSLGETAVFLTAVRLRGGFRPEGWVETYDRLLQHRLMYIRQLALKCLPKPIKESFWKLLAYLLTDPEHAVAREALVATESLDAPLFKKPVMDILRSSRSEKLVGLAIKNARTLKIFPESLLIIASRYDEPGMDQICKSILLSHVLELRSYVCGPISPENAKQLKSSWTSFIKKHMEEIRGGRRFAPGEPELTPELLPATCKIYLDNGEKWPPSTSGR